MASEKTPVVWDDDAKKHRPLGSGEKMGGLSASSMISADSGNLLQQGSDGLMLVTGSSLADPRADNLLEESANGKLQVTSDRMVEWLDGHPQAAAAIADAVKVVSGDDGNVIVQGTDKGAYLPKQAISSAVSGMTDAQKNQLADAISSRIASDIADGQTVTASNGKLHFDPTNATAAQKKAINQALADANSGLVVNNSTGKLGVDFSNMPTDKFEELLRGLKMQVPLAANLSLYVDKNSSAASDVIEDGRGTQAKPFKTIQACVNYATQTYALGRYSITIHVAKATYLENLQLPDFTHTSGSITIRGANYSDPPTLTNAGELSSVVVAIAGSWRLVRLNLYGEYSSNGDNLSHFMSVVNSNNANVTISGCNMSARFSGPATAGYSEIRMLVAVNNGMLTLSPMAGYNNTISCTPGNATTSNILHSERFGSLSLPSGGRSGETAEDLVIHCSGSCRYFAQCVTNSTIYVVTGSPFMPSFSGTMTGSQYQILSGSGIDIHDVGGFPGTAEGNDVETSTYCWYKG